MKKGRKEVKCGICGTVFERTLSQLKRAKNNYCSSKCRFEGQKVPEEQKKETNRRNNKKWKDINKEKIKEYNALYRKENKEKVNKLCRAWYKENRERKLAESKKRYQNNIEHYREKGRERQSKWVKDNPVKALFQRQRHKKKARITTRLRQVRKVAEKYNCKIGDPEKLREFYEKALSIDCIYCYYCKDECGNKVARYKKDATVDHKIPLSKGGDHAVDNLVIACRDCNSVKNAKTDKEFFEFLDIIKQL
jgi:5-methylcytosine-specific restriction endonuclease McrA